MAIKRQRDAFACACRQSKRILAAALHVVLSNKRVTKRLWSSPPQL